MNHSSTEYRPIMALVAACACWGIATVITKGLLASVSPIILLAVQLTISVVSLWSLVLIRSLRWTAVRRILRNFVGTLHATSLRNQFTHNSRYDPRWTTRTPWLRHALLGWLNPGVAYTLSLAGLATTSASMSTLLWATEPILILALAWLLLRERMSRRLLALSGIAVAGVLLMGGLGTDGAAAGEFRGNALILAGVLCCALYTILARHDGSATGTLFSLAIQQTAALAWAVVVWPLESWLAAAGPQLPQRWTEWAGSVASGLLYYAVAFWLYLYGLGRMPASLAGTLLNLTPVFGVAGAVLFLGERLAPAQWLGGTLVVVSMALIMRDRTETAPTSATRARASIGVLDAAPHPRYNSIRFEINLAARLYGSFCPAHLRFARSSASLGPGLRPDPERLPRRRTGRPNRPAAQPGVLSPQQAPAVADNSWPALIGGWS